MLLAPSPGSRPDPDHEPEDTPLTSTLDRRESTLSEVAGAFRAARRITAICHENPDADTIGAAVAIRLIAERLGVDSEIVSVDRPPPLFAFLPRINDVQPSPRLEPDLAVVCDAATLERVGLIAVVEADWLSRAQLVNIDHHVSNDRFGALNLVDPAAAATCEVVGRLVDELGLELDAELATALLTGIVRDSHGFSDLATSGDTLRMAARLVDAGAPLALIHRAVLAELPYATMALWGRMLAVIGQRLDGRIVYTVLTRQMLEETETAQHDADGVVEFMSTAKGAAVALLLREVGPSETRVSIRTANGVDAMQIAAAFGGGGHVRRAGCTINREVAASLDEVLAVASSAVAGEA
jgi:bifunctional oligoribonuclease and PAP phosphatase NrnA